MVQRTQIKEILATKECAADILVKKFSNKIKSTIASKHNISFYATSNTSCFKLRRSTNAKKVINHKPLKTINQMLSFFKSFHGKQNLKQTFTSVMLFSSSHKRRVELSDPVINRKRFGLKCFTHGSKTLMANAFKHHQISGLNCSFRSGGGPRNLWKRWRTQQRKAI